ncbi:phosphoglycerate dehydrogenase [Ekhidna sp.]|uniref:phosphoglycerate dehydrogenase n=1 Tax=Ekhidna sp. TaxID=2608089 RepID=UPI003B506BD0
MIKSDIIVGVTTVAFSKNQDLVNHINSLGFKKVKTNIAGKRLQRSELIEFLSDCNAGIVGLDIIDEDLLMSLPELKVISKYGVGLDNIDLRASERLGVHILHTEGVNKRSVSEMALGFILSLLRNLYITSNQLKKGTWNKSGGVQLTEKTVGIIGLGNIGKDLVQLLKPFNCQILINDIIDLGDYAEENGLVIASKQQIFKQADAISVHTPFTPETANLFNKNTFELMKPGAIIINTARGGIVNLDDLKDALKMGHIGGAAIDVYDTEPPTDVELLNIPNLLNTPHIGGNAKEAVQAMGQAAIINLTNYLK